MYKPFKLLIKDHQKVKKIIGDLLATKLSDKKERQTMLQNLKKELKLHEKIEEDYVYPVLENKKLTHELALEAYEEHHMVDTLLEEMEALDFDDESWRAKLTVLQENLLHHIDEEENDLFPKANKVVKEEKLKEIDEEIEAKKNKAK